MEQYHAYIHEITWTVITHFTDTHFNQVVKIDGNLVAFCNSSTYIKVWNRRKELNLLHKTFIYIEEPNISKVLRENPFLSKNFAWMASEIKFQNITGVYLNIIIFK